MVLNKSMQLKILKPYLRKKPASNFKKKFILPYMYSKLFGMFPYTLSYFSGSTDRLDLGIVSTILHAIVLLLTIQQSLTNSMKKLNMLEKLSQESPENNTIDPADQMRIFLAKLTDKTDYISIVFFVGAFLMSLKMARQVSSLQRYFDELYKDIEHQKKILPRVFTTKKQDPTMKRSVQIWAVLFSMSAGTVTVSRLMQPKRAVPLSELFKFCRDFVKLSSVSPCLEFCVICSMLQFYFVYINNVLSQMRAIDKVWQEAWFYEVLEKVGIWHRTLTRSLNQVNRMFQVQNLLAVVSATMNLLPHLFLVGIRLLGSVDKKEYSVIQFVLSMRFLLNIGLRCHFASMVVYEANKTKIHMCRFLIQRNDPLLLEQIKIIMQQMSCGDTNFCLVGLFNLNNRFFLATMLAVVGYFIIILQSYMSEIEDVN